jgi:hypothetical protein
MIGKDADNEFMYAFPFVVKGEHVAAMRHHVTHHTRHSTFEQAWFDMQNRADSWGIFFITGNYLHHFDLDDYVWPVVFGKASSISKTLPLIGKHLPMDQNIALTVNFVSKAAALCHSVIKMTSDEVHMAKFTPFTSYCPMLHGVDGYNMQAAKTTQQCCTT